MGRNFALQEKETQPRKGEPVIFSWSSGGRSMKDL
jgi:hypothetical protein